MKVLKASKISIIIVVAILILFAVMIVALNIKNKSEEEKSPAPNETFIYIFVDGEEYKISSIYNHNDPIVVPKFSEDVKLTATYNESMIKNNYYFSIDNIDENGSIPDSTDGSVVIPYIDDKGYALNIDVLNEKGLFITCYRVNFSTNKFDDKPKLLLLIWPIIIAIAIILFKKSKPNKRVISLLEMNASLGKNSNGGDPRGGFF